MPNKFQRQIFFHTNHYQRKFFYPLVIAFVLGCLIAWLSMAYFFLLSVPPDGSEMNQIIALLPGFIVIFTLVMLSILLWTSYFSNKIIGPYSRILKELDEVLDGKRLEVLHVRKGDTLFDELLKRVNKLIENYVKNR